MKKKNNSFYLYFFHNKMFFTDMEFLEVLTDGLEKVLMVHGAGREVITMYS